MPATADSLNHLIIKLQISYNSIAEPQAKHGSCAVGLHFPLKFLQDVTFWGHIKVSLGFLLAVAPFSLCPCKASTWASSVGTPSP